MAIKYYPKAGQILSCNLLDFKAPEIGKIRPAMIISPKLPYRSEIVTIVPLSTTPPRHSLPFVVKLSRNYVPDQPEDDDCWAKCDMVMNLALTRLAGFKIGRRKYHFPQSTPEDLLAVRNGVMSGLGFSS